MKRFFFPFVIVFSAILALSYSAYSKHNPYELRNGDIVFQSGNRGQAPAIKAATDSPWSHVGIVFQRDADWWVLEAVQPVRYTKLEDFIKRSPSSFYAMRLKDDSAITPESLKKAATWGKQQINKPYDLKFQWDDKKLYCSELVWKIYEHSTGIELCEPRPMRSYNLKHPTVAQLVKQRYGSEDKIPLKLKTVAPSDLAESPLLIEVPKL